MAYIKCKKQRWRDIRHIRTAVHSPMTTGKVERFFQILKNKLEFCRDHRGFRMRYNHLRPHASLNRIVPAEIYFNIWNLK